MNSPKAKNFTLISIIYLALFAIYNLIVFFIFDDFNNVFWTSYAFFTVAILINVGILLFTLKKSNVEAAFLGIPLLYFSVFYVVAELFASFIFMIAKDVVSIQLTVLIQAVFLLIFIIFAAAALLAKNATQQIEDTIKTNVANMQLLAVDVEMLERTCSDADLKKQLHILAEAIRYSDPMGHPGVAQLDEMIRSKITELKFLCQNNNIAEATQVCTQLQFYVKERNEKLVILK